MSERTDIPIDALVVYRRKQAHPNLRSFSWQTRRVDVTRTNIVHTERERETFYLVYSVSAGKNHFHLRLDICLGRWTLEEIEAGN